MPTTVSFIVRRKFKYGDKWMMPGDEFIPQGGKFDETIIRSSWVYMDTDQFAWPNTAQWRRKRKRKPQIGSKATERIIAESPPVEEGIIEQPEPEEQAEEVNDGTEIG